MFVYFVGFLNIYIFFYTFIQVTAVPLREITFCKLNGKNTGPATPIPATNRVRERAQTSNGFLNDLKTSVPEAIVFTVLHPKQTVIAHHTLPPNLRTCHKEENSYCKLTLIEFQDLVEEQKKIFSIVNRTECLLRKNYKKSDQE